MIKEINVSQATEFQFFGRRVDRTYRTAESSATDYVTDVADVADESSATDCVADVADVTEVSSATDYVADVTDESCRVCQQGVI